MPKDNMFTHLLPDLRKLSDTIGMLIVSPDFYDLMQTNPRFTAAIDTFHTRLLSVTREISIQGDKHVVSSD